MHDPSETIQELIAENALLKQKSQELERLEVGRKRTEEALRKSEKLYRSLFEHMLNGLAYCQMHFDDNEKPSDFTYLSVNRTFETLTGLRNVVGKRVTEVIPGMRESDPELFEIYGRVSKTGKPERFEMFVDSLQMWFSVSVYSPERGYFVAAFDVITERKRAEEVLQASGKLTKRLAQENELMAEIGRIISSTLNIEDVYARFTAKVNEAIPFDRIAVNTVNMKDYTRTVRYVNGDRFSGNRIGEVYSLVGTGIEQVVRTKSSLLISNKNREDALRDFPGIPSLQFGAQSTMIIPLISKDEVIGSMAVHSSQIDAYSENDLFLAERIGAQIAGAIANAQLFLERKQVEESLKESEAKYCDLYENAPDMYYSLDLATGAIKECNETFLRTTGYSKKELIGRPIFELYDADSAKDAQKSYQQFRVTGEIHDAERRVKCKDGRIIDVSLNVSAHKDKNGNIIYTRSIWRDITERKEQEEMIRTLSITDQLTGLYNRRGFIALGEQQLRVAERVKTGLLLLYADVDDLKQINDKLGHKSGDKAIIEVANVLQEVFRKMDIIARMGGDEFAVLAPEASLEYEDIIKNRLQDKIDAHNSHAGRDYNLSLSIGMVYHPPPPPNSLDELISCADSLMYEQKRRKMPLESQE